MRQITNSECLRNIAAKIRQSLPILVSRDPCFYLSSKSWSDSTLCCFVHWELVSTLLKDNPVFYLVIIQSFLNFPLISRIRSAERIRGIGGNF